MPSAWRSRVAAGLLCLALVGGAGFRFAELVRARLWLDEYVLLDVAASPVPALIARMSRDNSPPGYVLLAHAILQTGGDGELRLRAFSLLCSLLGLLVAAGFAFSRWGMEAAAVTTCLLGFSAVAIHYAVEIRPYALLSLLFLLFLGTLDRSMSGGGWPVLGLEGALIVAAIGLHLYALPLLLVGPAVALGASRPPEVRRQAAVSGAALALLLPSVLLPALRVPPEAREFLVHLWRGHGPFQALWWVVRDLLPTASWPSSIAPPVSPILRSAEVLAAFLVAALLVTALHASRVRLRTPTNRGVAPLALGALSLLVGSAALAFVLHAAGRPVVAPGRFAVLLTPAFALAVGAAVPAGSPSRVLALTLALLAAVSAGARWWQGESRGIRPETLTAEVFRRAARGPALVLTVGMTGFPLRYLLRDRPDVVFRSFPAEVEDHPGWWAPSRHLSDPKGLASEARSLSALVVAEAIAGRQVFLAGANDPVAAPLRDALAAAGFRPRPLNSLVPSFVELAPDSPPLRAP